MSTDTTRRRSSRALDWRSNPDLAAAAAYAVAAALVLALGRGLPAAVRIPIALPLLVFVPGYAGVAALFPASRANAGDGRERGIGGVSSGLSLLERLTLSTVASVALVPMAALVANAIAAVTLVPVLVGVVVVTLTGAAVAAYRRPAGDETRADPLSTSAGSRDGGHDGRGGSRLASVIPRDAVTLTAVAIATLLLATSAAVAFSGAPSGDGATEFYLVDDVDDGEFAGEAYSRTLEAGETATFALGIEHAGDEPREYTVVARLERVDRTGNATRVVTASELRRVTTTVDAGEPAVTEYRVEPGSTGEDLRMAFLLHRGEAPADPDRASAHRVVSLPVDVVPAGG